VASVVDVAARRTHQAARLRAESEILSFLAGSHDLRTPLAGIKASGPFRLGQRADQGKVPAMLESSEVNRRGLLAG
ncbi:hypothetical protein, partial [Streptomyces chattanoogensis]|uniref:hypothetical protein n=1 Tax=Streptomyces chattanoogensis TaxID=66876 RepID=UPI0036BA93CA